MHTATQLKGSQFSILVDAERTDVNTVFPGWSTHDRFGIVVSSPHGLVGASMLIQVAISLFYAARIEPPHVYPEIYAFDVGHSQGDHSAFDFYPPRKEVIVEDGPRALLAAINDRGITRLAVPEAPSAPADFGWQELAAARDRISSAFAYSPSGRVDDPDIMITGTTRDTEHNTSITLRSDSWPAKLLAFSDAQLKELDLSADDPACHVLRYSQILSTEQPYYRASAATIARHWASSVAARAGEVPPEIRGELIERRQKVLRNGLPTESYRRIDLDQALGMLSR